MNFEFLKTLFLTEHLWTAASADKLKDHLNWTEADTVLLPCLWKIQTTINLKRL